jgi:hypothetical protein
MPPSRVINPDIVATGIGDQLACTYRNGLGRDDPALQYANILIYLSPNRDKAQEFWLRVYGKDPSWVKSNITVKDLDVFGKYEYKDKFFFISEKIRRWDNTPAFDGEV